MRLPRPDLMGKTCLRYIHMTDIHKHLEGNESNIVLLFLGSEYSFCVPKTTNYTVNESYMISESRTSRHFIYLTHFTGKKYNLRTIVKYWCWNQCVILHQTNI